ncbi:UDP-N-acetylglucosamine--N-acetylmuramyl-(pentapeptide) pyrophosphoryl-undecaprenol N-acetylglucosamine transferase [Natronobacillus azotifigens]|uniref:UDP-N-acetylglucosamine--N-acetylmuramyl-(pentapeptide) pyrophosphoryl-undecaprenol N-acetylglucosamine transferase n=1 Tax=Natronobacillus azotifigens TaxID=472978 RepID=A0A9J6R8X2_9BACI|nr:undecaprenyldiphospho-muramoylpentapeptide beta-N-acetylglucosaminyltransferase [Natronobacillus azotifigens]MCZ0702080.1 undecaprenyldiphospho-muramoylpentapeptide beta-N-acetylglucosaminyltransferase [Natronobacillus azotifigens]
MKRKQIVLTGGGTAGHVMVNLAIIPLLKEQGWTIDYIGSKQGIERELIEQIDEVTYHPISTGKLRRYMSIENVKDPFKVIKGIGQTLRILGKTKPQVIFSKGGFVSVPVLIGARLRHVPAVIHESDITPGLANKLAMPFAKKILATFPETMEYLPDKKANWIGAVVRPELFEGDKRKGLLFADLLTTKPVLMIMGGSAGAQKINEAVRSQVRALTKTYQIIHLCGKNNVDSSINIPGYKQFEYINEELPDVLAATDFVVSRAGANSIFEFLALQKPMLLIPLSRQASRGDQILNANAFEAQGYAKVLEEEKLTPNTLIESLEELNKQAPLLKANMEKYQGQDATEKVMKIINDTAKK